MTMKSEAVRMFLIENMVKNSHQCGKKIKSIQCKSIFLFPSHVRTQEMLLQVHDALVFDVPKEEFEQATIHHTG